MNTLRRLFFKIVPCYRRLEHRFVSYKDADMLIRNSAGKSESLQWRIAPEEDHNPLRSWVHIERRERITQ
jgi:hypothetical protein